MTLLRDGKIKNKQKKQQKKVKMVVAATKEVNKVNSIQVASLGVTHRKNHKFKVNIDEVSSRVHNYFSSLGMRFIVNFDIDGSSLNRRKLHINRKSASMLIRNKGNFLNLISV